MDVATPQTPFPLDPRPGPSPSGPSASGPARVQWSGTDVGHWLAQRRNAGDTPAEIATLLVRHGWDADAAADTSLRSLRRSDRHRVLYATLCWSVGLAALGLATGLHQVLSPHLDHDARVTAAFSFTLVVVLGPLAGFCAWSAKRTEAESPHAVWSPTRRMWFGTLALCTATVGLIRLVTYVYRMIAAMVGARDMALEPSDQFQVVVSLAVAVPLLVWSFLEWRRSDVVISGLRERAS